MEQRNPFDTDLVLSGPYRAPKQMLATQQYDGHKSIHDDKTAEKLGLKAGPIEGPTHFTQFVPLLAQLWGQEWFETGRISVHFKNMVVEGEEVKAFTRVPKAEQTQVSIAAKKREGAIVLTGTASVGLQSDPSELDKRMGRLRPAERLIILRDMNVGDRGAKTERVRMDFDGALGQRYPFTLAEKLAVITERSPWHEPEGASPWGRPIIPLEMVCVLSEYTSGEAGWKLRRPHVGLFADLEIGMLKGPLFVGQDYLLERQVVALSESPRTEGFWVTTRILDAETNEPLAYVLLHHAIMKESFPGYDEELKTK